jgi:hypothetical protein
MFAYFYFGSSQGGNWDPEGRVALLSFSNSTTLGSVHFSSKPPSLGMCRYLCKKIVAKASLVLFV